MISTRIFLLLLLLGCLVEVVRPYTLISNGDIYTVDDDGEEWVEAVAIDDDDGTIIAVGTIDQIYDKLNGETETEYWDLQGQMMLPGFQDSHLHAVEAGINSELCYIEDSADLYDISFYFDDPEYCQNRGQFGSEGWIVGGGIDISKLAESVELNDYEYPIDVLDQDFGDTPVLIIDSYGHGAVVNSKAMELVGYDQLTGNPPGGIIDRDPEGNPTGIVRENAQQVFRNAAFPPTEANKNYAYDSLIKALGFLASNGITTVSDAGGFWKQAQTEAWARAEADGKLTVRASNALYVYPDIPIDEQLNELTSRFTNDDSKLVRFNQAKIYVDGILSLGTSALKEPYDYSPITGFDTGFEYFENQETLNDVVAKLADAGFQLHLHVTGDRGAELGLNALEGANSNPGPHRLTHCYLVDQQDQGRFDDLNVVADFQLAPSSLSPAYQNFMAEFIGFNRASNLLPALEVYNAGGLITLSSDWDADKLSPLTKLKTVLTRSDGKAIPDLATAIRMMTINPAILLQHESKTGSISVGKYADFVVLDQNIFDMGNNRIDRAYVVATVLQGKVVFDPEGVFGEVIGEYSSAPSWGKPMVMTFLVLALPLLLLGVSLL